MIGSSPPGWLTSPRCVVAACAAAAVLCMPAPGHAGPIKLNLAGVAVRGAQVVIKVGRKARPGNRGRINDSASPSTMSGGESGGAFSGPGSSGNNRFWPTDITSQFEIADYRDSAISGGDLQETDRLPAFAEELKKDLRREDRHGVGNDAVYAGNGRSSPRNGGAPPSTRAPVGSSDGPIRVPEPGTVTLFGAGLFGIVTLMKGGRKSKAL